MVSLWPSLAHVRQTTEWPAQWDAWTITGQYLYLRYRSGIGSVTPYPSPDWETWDPTVQPLIEWDDDSGESEICLADFLEAAGLRLVLAPPTTWRARMHSLLRRLTRRCDVHDKPSYPRIRDLEQALGMPPSAAPRDLVDALSDPTLVDCGHSWCQPRR